MRRYAPALVLSVALLAVVGVWWAGARPPESQVRPSPAQVGAAPTAVPPSATRERGPNVLILLWDTVRADRMSLYGHDRETTPWLEGFARDAVVYERAIAPGMWTVPSHGSLFTGLPVASHGANARWIWLDGRFETLAERMGEAGWDTWAWSSNPYLSSNTNLLQGFDTVVTSWQGEHAEAVGAATSGKLVARDASVEISPAWKPAGHGKGWPEHLTAYKDGGTVVPEAFTAWLDSREGERPWLAYVNYLEAHHPRVPSLSSREGVLAPELLERGLSTDASLFRAMASMEGHASFEEAELEAIRGVYDAALRDLDAATGGLIDRLAARGDLDDTVVIVVSDHGEHLGEHDMFDHRWSVWQELLHVPLVIRYPKRLAPARVTETVSTQDVFATVLDLAGLPPAAVPSRSLVAGPPGDAFAELIQPTPRLPFIKQAFDDLDPDRWRARYQVQVDGTWKFVRVSDGKHHLFDLAADPGEAMDVLGSEAERAERMKQAVIDWQQTLDRYDPAGRAPTDKPENALRNDTTREQLEALGYAEE